MNYNEQLRQKITAAEQRRTFAVYSRKGSLPEIIYRKLSAAEYTEEYLRYIIGYGDYISEITDRSDFLSDISIYKQDSEILANILNTRKDYYRLENITLTPVCESGFMLFLNYRLTDIFAAIVPIIFLSVIPGLGAS